MGAKFVRMRFAGGVKRLQMRPSFSLDGSVTGISAMVVAARGGVFFTSTTTEGDGASAITVGGSLHGISCAIKGLPRSSGTDQRSERRRVTLAQFVNFHESNAGCSGDAGNLGGVGTGRKGDDESSVFRRDR